jgi:hypothetical protein
MDAQRTASARTGHHYALGSGRQLDRLLQPIKVAVGDGDDGSENALSILVPDTTASSWPTIRWVVGRKVPADLGKQPGRQSQSAQSVNPAGVS